MGPRRFRRETGDHPRGHTECTKYRDGELQRFEHPLRGAVSELHRRTGVPWQLVGIGAMA
jgi:hypothetical protein